MEAIACCRIVLDRANRRAGRGFTIVELLVVIAIIGVLLALLMPAVQSAREAMRRCQCANNLKQLAQGALHHEQIKKRYPTGSWGWDWDGDADRDGVSQPGGWAYNLLNYIEQPSLAALGAKAPATDATGNVSQAKMTATATLVSTPLPIFHCPTRRPAKLYANALSSSFVAYNTSPLTAVARIDYAANAGDSGVDQSDQGPPTFAMGDAGYAFASTSGITGVCFLRSMISAVDIKDGLSNTYLYGEKYLIPDHYYDGLDGADNEDAYTGWDNDLFRNTNVTPLPDTPGLSDTFRFGSAHASTFNMVFCDGAVRPVSYSIDATTHQRLGNRIDNKPVNLLILAH